MVDVFWLEQSAADVPSGNDWLDAREFVCLNRMRFAPRRADWRLGRWTAKRAVAAHFNVPGTPAALGSIEIRPEETGAPEVFMGNRRAPVAISLSHRSGLALCMVAPPGTKLGCDLEVVESRTEAFIADYFTHDERELIAEASSEDRFRLVALLWSAKESTLKALRAGLRLDTRAVVVSLEDAAPSRREHLFRPACGPNDWRRLAVRHTDGQLFHGWWQHSDHLMRTMVAATATAPPTQLHVRTYVSNRVSICS